MKLVAKKLKGRAGHLFGGGNCDPKGENEKRKGARMVQNEETITKAIPAFQLYANHLPKFA